MARARHDPSTILGSMTRKHLSNVGERWIVSRTCISSVQMLQILSYHRLGQSRRYTARAAVPRARAFRQKELLADSGGAVFARFARFATNAFEDYERRCAPEMMARRLLVSVVASLAYGSPSLYARLGFTLLQERLPLGSMHIPRKNRGHRPAGKVDLLTSISNVVYLLRCGRKTVRLHSVRRFVYTTVRSLASHIITADAVKETQIPVFNKACPVSLANIVGDGEKFIFTKVLDKNVSSMFIPNCTATVRMCCHRRITKWKLSNLAPAIRM